MNQEKIGKFIQELRKEKNMTQLDLANMLNVTDRAVSNWETGRRMPDISSIKLICETFDISFSEFLNGEKIPVKDLKSATENVIVDTYKSSEINKKKYKNYFRLLIVSLVILALAIGSLVIYYKVNYPKIDKIFNIAVAPSRDNLFNKYMEKDGHNIWFYALDSVQISSKGKSFALRDTLKFNQINLDQIKNYLENDGDTKKYTIKDVGTVYKNYWFTAVLCDSKDGNKDIYFGSLDFENELVGNYCGKENSHTFTRTYYVSDVLDNNDYDYIDIVVAPYTFDPTMVKIKRNDTIKKGKNYEFTFKTTVTFEDTVSNVFKYSTIIDIKETNKTGVDQINEFLIYE